MGGGAVSYKRGTPVSALQIPAPRDVPRFLCEVLMVVLDVGSAAAVVEPAAAGPIRRGKRPLPATRFELSPPCHSF